MLCHFVLPFSCTMIQMMIHVVHQCILYPALVQFGGLAILWNVIIEEKQLKPPASHRLIHFYSSSLRNKKVSSTALIQIQTKILAFHKIIIEFYLLNTDMTDILIYLIWYSNKNTLMNRFGFPSSLPYQVYLPAKPWCMQQPLRPWNQILSFF